jgi:dolichol-phosphate mannosyltransferase
MPQTAPFLSVVIPMKNEEGNVAPLLDELCEILDGLASYEVIAVDDGSTDETWRVLRDQKSRRPGHLRLVRLDRNYGQSTGFWAGLSRVRGEVVVMMDGDRQNDPHDIPKLLAEIEKGADVCQTWRADRQDSGFRKFQSRIGNGVRNWLLSSSIRDTGSQLRAFRAHCLKDLPRFEGMHRFMCNLFLMRGYKIVEVPTHHRSREAGATKYGIGNRMWRGIRDVFGMRWLARRTILYGVEQEDD